MKDELYKALDSLAPAYAEPNIKEDGLPRFSILGKKAKAYGMVKKAIDKLVAIEDFEQEFGVDLTILLKALKNGYYYRTNLVPINRIRYADRNTIELLPYDSGWLLRVSVDTRLIDACRVEDYGKTWALTKEELE